MTSAVLIIDVQQGLCEGEHRPWEIARVIERLNLVADTARAAGAPVIFVQHEGSGGYLEHGSRAWQLADGLRVAPTDVRVRKTTPDAFNHTALSTMLAARGVTDLVIGGMHTEFCVDTTTRRALSLGYPVILVADGHTTEGNEHLSPLQVIQHHNSTLSNITSFGPRVRPVPAAEISFG